MLFSRRHFGWLLPLFFVAVGMLLVVLHRKHTDFSFSPKPMLYEAVIMDVPQIKENSVCCYLQLTAFADSIRAEQMDRKAVVYIVKDTLTTQLRCGDHIRWYGTLSAPQNAGNPYAFDYASYLYRKGISAVGVIYRGQWTVVKDSGNRSLWVEIRKARAHLVRHYHSLALSDDNRAIFSALTLGYRQELSARVKEHFSTAGVSHLLAISGLHVGILAGFLYLLLRFLGNRWYMKLFRSVVLLAVLGFYALFTGLSPSVVRSVIMFSLFTIGAICSTRGVAVNTLAATAFFMLLYEPYALYAVGFQLSFLAVFSILIVMPRITPLWKPKTLLLRYLWQIIALSIAAQLFTLPLLLFYFSKFPLFFLLANCVAVPLLSVVLYLSFLVLLLWPISTRLVAFGVPLLDKLLSFFNYSITWVASLGHSVQLHFTKIDVLLSYALLLLAFARFIPKARRYKLLFVASCCTLLFYCSRYFSSPVVKPMAYFYAVQKCPAIHFIASPTQSYVWYIDAKSDTTNWCRSAYAFCDHSGVSYPQHLQKGAPLLDADLVRHPDIVAFGQQVFAVWHNDRWLHKKASHPLHIDYLYICKGYKGKLKALTALFTIRYVVLDASLSRYAISLLEKTCDNLGIQWVSLRDSGAFSVKKLGIHSLTLNK